jgi:hypothetical protein
MPYAKRHTTPTNAAETEGALVVGYWVATRRTEGVVVRLCEKHMNVVNALDGQEEARIAAEKARPVDHQLDPHFQARLAEVNQRKEQLIASAAPKPIVAAPPPSPVPFALGPGPLNNGNLPTTQPELPQAVGLAQAYTVTVPQPTAEVVKNPNLPQAPVQGAALIDAPCLFCKVMIKTGEVHNCPQAGATSGINPIG